MIDYLHKNTAAILLSRFLEEHKMGSASSRALDVVDFATEFITGDIDAWWTSKRYQ